MVVSECELAVGVALPEQDHVRKMVHLHSTRIDGLYLTPPARLSYIASLCEPGPNSLAQESYSAELCNNKIDPLRGAKKSTGTFANPEQVESVSSQ